LKKKSGNVARTTQKAESNFDRKNIEFLMKTKLGEKLTFWQCIVIRSKYDFRFCKMNSTDVRYDIWQSWPIDLFKILSSLCQVLLWNRSKHFLCFIAHLTMYKIEIHFLCFMYNTVHDTPFYIFICNSYLPMYTCTSILIFFELREKCFLSLVVFFILIKSICALFCNTGQSEACYFPVSYVNNQSD
jgi:hypothetical protein